MINLIISLILIVVGQCLIYFQGQSQFFWPWAKAHPVLMSLVGIPASLLFIYFIKYNAMAFDGQTWPGRIISFSAGTIVFAFLSSFVMGEAITAKTGVCIALSIIILLIQIFWK
jgi:hypothetical protein